MKIGLKRIISLCSLICVVGCGVNTSSELLTTYQVIDKSASNVKTKDGSYVMPFNTIVTLRTFSEKDSYDIFPKFDSEIQKLHILSDRYNDFVDEDGNDITNLKDINESYGSNVALRVDQDLIDLLKLSIELSVLTEGYFNPTLGELIDTWNYKYVDGEKYVRFSPYCFDDEDPSSTLISESHGKIIPYNDLSNYIVIDDEQNTVMFKKYNDVDKITISLGAIAKGYAVEKTKKMAVQYNVPLMIDGGSSSSYGIGKNPNPNRDYWLVGIASPYKVALNVQAIATLRFDDTYTLSVSGDYESCYKNSEGIIRHHILNPFTGYPENYYRVVSLKSYARSDILDGLSTAIFNIESPDKVMEIVNKVQNHYDIDIAVLLEKEVDKENQKIDLYLTESYDYHITKTNSKYCNEKNYI